MGIDKVSFCAGTILYERLSYEKHKSNLLQEQCSYYMYCTERSSCGRKYPFQLRPQGVIDLLKRWLQPKSSAVSRPAILYACATPSVKSHRRRLQRNKPVAQSFCRSLVPFGRNAQLCGSAYFCARKSLRRIGYNRTPLSLVTDHVRTRPTHRRSRDCQRERILTVFTPLQNSNQSYSFAEYQTCVLKNTGI